MIITHPVSLTDIRAFAQFYFTPFVLIGQEENAVFFTIAPQGATIYSERLRRTISD
jgi:hypothetical protein